MNIANMGVPSGTRGSEPTQIPGMDGVTNKANWGGQPNGNTNGAPVQQPTQVQPQANQTNVPPQQTGILAKLAAKYGAAATPTETNDNGFGKLFNPQAAPNPAAADPTKPATHNSNTPPAATNHWDTSGEALGKKFGALDVTAYVKPELMTAALGGDAASMMEVLNTTMRLASMSAYKQAMEDAKSGVSQETGNLQSKLPDLFKDLSITNTLGQDPILSAPHLKPLVDKVRTDLLAAYPRATEADVKEAAMEYLSTLGSQFGAPAARTTTQQASDGTDWNKHFQAAMNG